MILVLYVLAIMVLPLVLALAVVWWLSGKVTRRIGWRLLSLAIVPVVAFWDLVPTRHAFDWLCEHRSGLQIRKVVHDVPGFVVLGLPRDCFNDCANFLADLGYRFVEGTPSRDIDGKIERFRYWLAPEGDAHCQALPPNWVGSETAKKLTARLDNRCIAREAISEFTSDYALVMPLRIDPNVIWPLEIHQISRRVFDLGTDETLAETNTYENYSGWYVRRFVNALTPYPAETCPTRGSHFNGRPSVSEREGQIRNVLVPPQRETK